MIAACPECRTQYRVDPQRLSEEGVRLRCTRCETIFRVRAPQAAAPAAAPPPPPAPEPPATPPAPEPPPAPASPAPVEPAAEGLTPLSERLVLVATPDAALAKSWADALRGWGLEALAAQDGVETMLQIQRRLPRAVVLDAQLSKMFGFQICEFMKRNDSLRRIGVVLIGAVHHPTRYHRGPSEIYGADAYVEAPDLPEALAPLLRDLGLPLGPASTPAAPPPAETPAPPAADVAPEPPPPPVPPPVPAAPEVRAPAPAPPPVAEAPPPPAEAPPPPAEAPPPAAPAAPEPPPTREPEILSAPEPVSPPAPPPAPEPAPAVEAPPAAEAPPPPSADGGDPEVARAERLARIIISDVILYNQEKFEAAVATGNVLDALQADLVDGRAHFAQRIPEPVRAQRDFLSEELLRVARSRGTTG